MGIGRMARSVLGDIANAIRSQNGTGARYRPGEMAAAVRALDGTGKGAGPSYEPQAGSGVLGASCLSALADAIRAQNGLDVRYRPAEMAPAILALRWDAGLKPRALLLDDGTLELNYLDGRRSATGGTVVEAWEVPAEGFSSSYSRSWDSAKLLVRRAVIDDSFASSGVTSCAYWFTGFTAMTEVAGLQNLVGVVDATQTFSSCKSLETIWATGFDASGIARSTSVLYGCSRLVGGSGFVPSNTTGASALALGDDGVLTDPANDTRRWYWCLLYDDVLVLSASPEPEGDRVLVASGRLCAQARYAAVGATPWYAHRADVRRVEFAPDMATYDEMNLSYLFYGHQALCEVVGFANLRGVRQMYYAFNSCPSLVELDLTGLDPSHLTLVNYAFGGCEALRTIYADADWETPKTGFLGPQTFYNCKSLVGGNGTTYSVSRTSCQYMRIDRAGQEGYLTAG